MSGTRVCHKVPDRKYAVLVAKEGHATYAAFAETYGEC